MILCRDTKDVGGGGIMEGSGCPPWKDIGRQESRAMREKNKYVTIINRS